MSTLSGAPVSRMRPRMLLALAIGSASLAALCATPAAAQVDIRTDDPAGALRYFIEQRADASGRIPFGARSRALMQMESRWPQSVRQRKAMAFGSPPSASIWTPLGPAPLSGSNPSTGRLNTIAIHPTNSQIIYVGGAQGGVWKTVNGGTTWAPLTDDQCSLAMGSVVIDPVNPEIVYAGTGEQNFSGDSYYGCGILRSVNGGATWSQFGASTFDTPTGGARISRLLIDRATAGSISTTVIFAASDFGLYRSANSGFSWTRVLTGVTTDLVVDPTQPATLFAGIGATSFSANNGIYTSTNTGITWTKLAGGLPISENGRSNLAIAPSDGQTLYASFMKTTDLTLLGIWKSIDAGTTWTKLAATGASCGTQCWYDMSIGVDPSSASTLLFGGVSLFRSINGGATFALVPGPHVDHHAVAWDPALPGTVYVGNDGGIWRSVNSGSTWTSLNTNLALTQFYSGVSVSPLSANTISAGTQDNGTLEWTGANAWPIVLGGDGGYTAIDHRLGTTAYAETQWTGTGGGGGPRRRDPGSTNFLLAVNGIAQSDRGQFIPPLVMDPVNPNALYFGTYRLYRTGDRAVSWTPISPDLSRTGFGTISAIAVSPVDSQVIVVGLSDGNVRVTRNLGQTWAVATSGLPTRFVSDFALDPRDPKTAYVVFGGFGGGHVFKTTDLGESWTNVSFDLPDVPVLAITLQPGLGELNIGTDIGVFALARGASSWTPVTNGLPVVAVYDLVFDKTRGRLIAATHGRGMFALDVNVAGLRGDITNDGVLSALDAQAILSSVVGLPVPGGSVRWPNGDANCDGDVTAFDALLVLTKVVGLPVGSFCVGVVR